MEPPSPPSLVPRRPADRERRAARICLGLLVATTLASLPFLAHGHLDPKNDACMYVLLARSLVGGEGYSLLGDAFALRPPGFPLLIAPLLAVFGTDLGVLNLAVNLFGVLTVVLLFVLAHPRLGARLACAVSLFVWLNPGFRASCNQVMSDVPGTAFLLAVLVAARHRDSGVPRAFAVGLLVGAATLVRTMNVLVLPAFLLASVLRRGPERAAALRSDLVVLLGAACLLAPWSVRNARAELPAPTEQTSIHSYATGMFHADPSDPASPRLPAAQIASRIPLQLGQIAETLGSRFTDAGGPFSSPPGPASVAGALALLCVALVAARRREPLELTALALFGVVALYFAFVDRLVLPLFVLGVPAVAEVLCQLVRPLGTSRARLAAGALLLALSAFDARHLPRAAPLAEREQRMRTLAAALDEQLPAGAPLAARLGWELGVYLEDRRVYSLYVVAKRAQTAGMLELLARRGVDHCVFDQNKRDDRTLRKALTGVFRRADVLGDWWLMERQGPE